MAERPTVGMRAHRGVKLVLHDSVVVVLLEEVPHD